MVSKFARRSVLTLTVLASLALVAPVSAGAKTPHPPLTIQQYRTALHAYQQAKDAIDLTLHQSIASAKAAEMAAMAAAKTEAQKYLARVDFNEARATDVANWQTALSNLGPPPLPPLDYLPILSSTTTTVRSTDQTSQR